MQTKTIQAPSLEQFQSLLSKAIAEDFQPTLAIGFSSLQHDIQTFSALFKKHDIELVGCSTAGEIYNGAIANSSISVLLLDMPVDYYDLCYVPNDGRTTYQTAFQVGQRVKEVFADSAVIMLSGGVSIDAEQIISGVKDAAGDDVMMYGGLAGDDLQMKNTFVYTNTERCEEGLLALIIDREKIEVQGMATSGWEPIGTVNTITKAKGNVVYQINDEPALDVFIKYFGFFDNSRRGEKHLEIISGQYPMQLMRDKGAMIMRAPLAADEENRSLVLAGGVQEGENFRFSISPGFEVIDQTISEFNQFGRTMPEADALLLFSCVGRHAALGPLLEDEVKGIHGNWNKPMVGFMTYGEIGNTLDGPCEFHNETCSLVILKEK